jgi:glycosyltransferase involved in cell wall biosynthesis
VKIVVNAIALRVAGGRSVGQNFLRAYEASANPHELLVFAPAGCGYEELASDRLRVEAVPARFHRSLLRGWVDQVWARRMLARERPDALFSMGNVAWPTDVPQLVLFHWPYAIYPEKEVWERMGLREATSRRIRRRLFRRRLPYATRVAAQTEVARDRLIEYYGLSNVTVVPNAVSLPDAEGFRPLEVTLPADKRVLLCLTRYYPHKNHDVLLPLARLMKQRGAPYAIVTTVSERDGEAARRFISRVRQEALEDVILNLGEVPHDQIPALYGATDALLLPTLLESFSGTYVEAMHFGRPVCTSDRDFARTVCGDAAYYFDPHSPEDILRVVEGVFSDDAQREARIERGRSRCRSHPGWPEAAQQYVDLLVEIART